MIIAKVSISGCLYCLSFSSSISLEEKASFGQYARSESGRVWFGRYITKEVSEESKF